MTREPAADVVDAELVDDGPDWSAALVPARPRGHGPRYLVDRHTVLGPGEMPPTMEELPRYSEADFRISADTAQRRARAGADNTRINRDATIRRFEAWCAGEGRVARPCTDATYLEYAGHLMRRQPRLKPDTIGIYLGHLWRWQPAGLRPDRLETLELLETYRRENPRASRKRQAPALRLPDVLAMLAAVDETTATGKRDAALLAVMYLMLARRSEIPDIDLEYTQLLHDQVVIDLAADKNHQSGEGLELIRLHDRPDLRPVRRVRAWRDWLKGQGVIAGPLFRQLSTGDRLTARALSAGPQARLSPAAVGERIQVLAERAGVSKPAKITSQGIRAGGATDLAEAGAGGRALRRAGRWRETSTVPENVYVRPIEDDEADPFASVFPRAGQ
ncbi:site-specific integrase [Streptacidiphilus rugosus]|uniref:tyrosine-type recombinase/integrase n=1 Tax=Streptacidiphilus rugosus TaxID=405783 RepID=UPI000563C33B|nr:tyrosine-type recombinase/integrase [Streptacidiphilus rugosus]